MQHNKLPSKKAEFSTLLPRRNSRANVSVKRYHQRYTIIPILRWKLYISVNKEAVIVISFIGYVRAIYSCKEEDRLMFLMKDDTQSLDEVVVVACMVQSKATITGPFQYR